MARVVGIGQQDFADIRRENLFYIDKTHFIKEWWDSKDSVTLITRPRRFGKTLTISMVEHFFPLNMQEKTIFLRDLQSGRKRNTGKSKEPGRLFACPLQM